MNHYLIAAILGLVEGLTEFLPVSSTAHIRIAQDLLGLSMTDNFWKLFAVVIQLPAILAVVVYFWPKLLAFAGALFQRRKNGDVTRFSPVTRFCPDMEKTSYVPFFRQPVVLIAVATVVTAVPAALAKKLIKNNLESLTIIGSALIVGGIVMYFVDQVFGERGHRIDPDAPPAETPAHTLDGKIDSIAGMKLWQAIWIGAVQVLSAIFPGTSRSMCTIAAGQTAGLTRTAALEFSFFLSIPIIIAACAKDLRDSLNPRDPDAYIGRALTSHDLICIGIGGMVSFVVALAVIAWFMAWVRRRGFTPFAVYRVLIGAAVLTWALRGG